MNASDVLNRLTSHKRSQAPLMELLRLEQPSLSSKLHSCGSWMQLREWLESGESRIKQAFFCKEFLACRSCAARRAAKLTTAYASKVEHVTAGRSLIPAMVTLTVRNGADLGERLSHLKQSWARMTAAKRRSMSNGRHAPIEWCKVEGSIRAIEVTNKGKGWHPHAHVFVLLNSYIDQKRLSAEWERFTGDSKVVGVTACKGGILPGLIEVLKYASKITDMTPAQVLNVWRTAKGSRFVDPQGILRGVEEPDIDTDDMEGLQGPYRDYIAMWLYGEKRYALQSAPTGYVIDRPNKPSLQFAPSEKVKQKVFHVEHGKTAGLGEPIPQ